MTLELLRLHIRNHDIPKKDPTTIVIKNISPFDVACPLTSCNKILHRSVLQGHIRRHGVLERKADESALLREGYDPATANIICPICQEQFVTHSGFEDHVQAAHLIEDVDHFNTFHNHVVREYGTLMPMNNLWMPWGLYALRTDEVDLWELRCPYCGEFDQKSKYVKHHQSLLREPDTIRPFRSAILRLWPEFSTRPVFDDILPTVNRSGWRWRW